MTQHKSIIVLTDAHKSVTRHIERQLVQRVALIAELEKIASDINDANDTLADIDRAIVRLQLKYT